MAVSRSRMTADATLRIYSGDQHDGGPPGVPGGLPGGVGLPSGSPVGPGVDGFPRVRMAGGSPVGASPGLPHAAVVRQIMAGQPRTGIVNLMGRPRRMTILTREQFLALPIDDRSEYQDCGGLLIRVHGDPGEDRRMAWILGGDR